MQALTLFPRKSHRLFQKRERTPSPKLPLTAILSLTLFTLISSLLVGFVFGNERANYQKLARPHCMSQIFLGDSLDWGAQGYLAES